MLTGLPPMAEACNEENAAKRIKKGEKPFISDGWEEQSFAEAQLVAIIHDCLEYYPSNRPTIEELIERLRTAVEANRWHKNRDRKIGQHG